MSERNGPWSDLENDAIVADYMAMLADDLAGRHYSKAEHNRQLQELIGRGRGSIEYKHQNISAVLKGLGETGLRATSRPSTTRPAWKTRSPAGCSSVLAGTPARARTTGSQWRRSRQEPSGSCPRPP